MRQVYSRQRSVRASSEPRHERWLLSYSDFVTLLFAVFVVLFASAWKQKQPIASISSAVRSGFDSMRTAPAPRSDAQLSAASQLSAAKAQAQAEFVKEDSAARTKRLYEQLRMILGASIDRQEIVMQQTPDGVVISLRELGFFASGEATLLPGAAEKLTQAAQALKRQGCELRVEGHSDDQPIHSMLFQSNWELSVARAMSVMKLLVEGSGFPEERISVAGYGAFRPVATNSTPEGRQQNRRVDLVISPQHPEASPAGHGR
jgi:chemotaxis protein MotB